MIKNIIFDWSGVINDNVQVMHCIVNRMFEHFHINKISLEELHNEWEQPYMRFYHKYLPHVSIDEQKKQFSAGLVACPSSTPYPGIVDLIKEFKQNNIGMAILSSDAFDVLHSQVKEFGLAGVFDEIKTDVHDKNDMIEEIMERNNFQSIETVHVGDTAHEVEVGKKIGTKTCAVTWGLYPEERLQQANPDYIVRTVDELRSLILNESI